MARRRGRRRGRARRTLWRAGLLLVCVAAAGGVMYRTLTPLVAEARHQDGLERVESHGELLREVGRETRTDPNLLAAIMFCESSGRVDAVSHAGALGLFQLMLPTAAERARILRLPEPSEDDLLTDARLNTRLAAHYLRWLERRYDGDLEQMLIAYNAGPGRLARWIRDAGSYAAWRAEREAAGDSGVLRYVAKVQRHRELFQQRGVVAPQVDHPPQPTVSAPVPTRADFGPPPPEHADADALEHP